MKRIGWCTFTGAMVCAAYVTRGMLYGNDQAIEPMLFVIAAIYGCSEVVKYVASKQ
jgi:hypothetical protein